MRGAEEEDLLGGVGVGLEGSNTDDGSDELGRLELDALSGLLNIAAGDAELLVEGSDVGGEGLEKLTELGAELKGVRRGGGEK